MTMTTTLLKRNREFANNFDSAELAIIPKLRTVIISCADARVDPAHVLSLELGDAVVIRNNGGRVTQAVVEELAAMSFMVAKMDGAEPGPFEVIIMHHTQCGAERFADLDFQNLLKQQIGVDVSSTAISDHKQSLRDDIETLCNAPEVPGYIVVSGFIYDVQNGLLSEVVAPAELNSMRL